MIATQSTFSSILRKIRYIKSITVDILTYHLKYPVQELLLAAHHSRTDEAHFTYSTVCYHIILYNTSQRNA